MKDNAIYLEVDEDITSAIDKLSKTTGNAIQIVVPKRSSMLQSIINLKLLKKAAENSGKELVLVTSDRVATDLAARVGLAVAPSLGAKATMAEAKIPEELKSNEEIIEADDPEPPPLLDPTPPKPAKVKRPFLSRRAVGDAPVPVPPPPLPGVSEATAGASEAAASGAIATSDVKGKPKVPNFQRLQRRVIWVGVLALLVGGYALGMTFLTSAKVTLYANGTKIDIDTNFAVDPSLKATDDAKGVLAGQLISLSKDLSGTFNPSGKKDIGTKATGTITVSNSTGVDQALVAGTKFAAPDGRIFRSNQDINVPKAYLNSGGDKVNGTQSVEVTADQNGDTYNEAPAAYTIPNLANPKITAQGAQMSGGVSKTVTIVTAGDVETAKAAALDKDKDNVARDLKGKLPSGYIELTASQATVIGKVSAAPAIEAEGDNGTVTVHVTYTVLAVKQDEYHDLLRVQELKQIGKQNQIYDDGLKAAQITATPAESSGRQSFHLTTEAFGGAKLDTAAIAKQLAGKRYGDAAELSSKLPGIARADIVLWPGWATNLPSRTDKIKITVQVARNQ